MSPDLSGGGHLAARGGVSVPQAWPGKHRCLKERERERERECLREQDRHMQYINVFNTNITITLSLSPVARLLFMPLKSSDSERETHDEWRVKARIRRRRGREGATQRTDVIIHLDFDRAGYFKEKYLDNNITIKLKPEPAVFRMSS